MSGLDPAAVATGFVAVVVTLFVAHTMQAVESTEGKSIDEESELAARARAVFLDDLVFFVGFAGATAGWVLIQLPPNNNDPRSANFLIPLGSIMICSALAALTSRSAESKRLARITTEQQTVNLASACEEYETHLDAAIGRGAAVNPPTLTLRQRLRSWGRVFPWPRLVATCVGWAVSACALVGARGSFTAITGPALLALAALGAGLAVTIVGSVVDGIVTRTAAGRTGLVTVHTVVALLPGALFAATGVALFTVDWALALLVVTFGALPLVSAWSVLRSTGFRQWVGLSLRWRLTSMEHWLSRQGPAEGNERSRRAAERPNEAEEQISLAAP